MGPAQPLTGQHASGTNRPDVSIVDCDDTVEEIGRLLGCHKIQRLTQNLAVSVDSQYDYLVSSNCMVSTADAEWSANLAIGRLVARTPLVRAKAFAGESTETTHARADAMNGSFGEVLDRNRGVGPGFDFP
jgi:hypothetical protein